MDWASLFKEEEEVVDVVRFLHLKIFVLFFAADMRILKVILLLVHTLGKLQIAALLRSLLPSQKKKSLRS